MIPIMDAERKFIMLQKKLNVLNYTLPLGIESAPLVEAILTDLIRATESYGNLTNQNNKITSDWQSAVRQVEPLRKTNERLIRENNQLHADILSQKESAAEREKNFAEENRKLKKELKNLQLLNNQHAHLVRAKENELDKEKARIDDLLKKGAVFSLPNGGPEEDIIGRKQDMALSHVLDGASSIPRSAQPDPMTFDLLKLADKKMEQLQIQINALESDKAALDEGLRTATRQLQSREREILRLSRAVEAGSDTSMLVLEQQRTQAETSVQQLSMQLEYMHKKMAEAEAREKERDKKDKEDEERRNRSRSRSPSDKQRDEKARNGRAASTSPTKKNAKPIPDLVAKTDSRASDDVLAENARLVLEKNKLITELREVSNLLSALQEQEIKQGEDGDAETSALQVRLAESVKTLQSLEEQNRNLSDIITHRTAALHSLENQNQCLRKELEERSKDHADGRSSSLEKERAHLLGQIGTLSRERDSLADRVESISRDRSDLAGQIEVIAQERDGLISAIGGFEQQLSEIQSSILKLTEDRDRAAAHLSAAELELTKKDTVIRMFESRAAQGTSDFGEKEKFILDLENKIADLEGVLQSLRGELDDAHEQSRVVEALNRDLEAQIAALKARAAEGSKNSSQTAGGSKSGSGSVEYYEYPESDEGSHSRSLTRSSLRSTPQTQSQPQSQLQSQSMVQPHSPHNLRNHVSTLQGMLAEKQETLQDALGQSARQKTAFERTLAQLTDELDGVRAELARREEEVTAIKRSCDAIDKERDRLQALLDDREEEVHELASVRGTEEESKSRVTTQLVAAQEHAERLSELLQSKDSEIIGLSSQVQALTQEKATLEASLHDASLKLAAFSQDLTTMSKENQLINQDLNNLGGERDSQAQKLREYVGQLVYLQEALKSKDREKSDLMISYKALVDENQSLNIAAKQYHQQVEVLSKQILRYEQEVRHMAAHISEIEDENEKYVINLQNFERQVDSLGKTIRNADEKIKSSESENERLNRELSQAREYGLKISANRDALQRELAFVHQQCERMGEDLKDEATKAQDLAARLEQESLRVVELEEQVRRESLKEINVHISKESIEMELARSKELVAKLQAQAGQYTQRMRELETEKDVQAEKFNRQNRLLVQSNYELDAVSKNLREYQDKTGHLEKVVDEQNDVLSKLGEERSRFRNFAMLYEARLKKSEDIIAELESKLRVNDDRTRRLESDLRSKGFAEARLQDELTFMRTSVGAIAGQSPSSSLSVKSQPADSAQREEALGYSGRPPSRSPSLSSSYNRHSSPLTVDPSLQT